MSNKSHLRPAGHDGARLIPEAGAMPVETVLGTWVLNAAVDAHKDMRPQITRFAMMKDGKRLTFEASVHFIVNFEEDAAGT